MVKQFFLVLLLLLGQLAHAETPAQANKRLFDRTIDELNFRTMETVYDKSFTRGKFPITLRTAAARRNFDGFGTNTALRQLFMNYNGVAERYKNRYGNGPNTLAEFEKQLNSVLLDKNFEFFIHNLPRDERVALIRAEQRLIQQATAQFNASGAPEEVAAVPPADVDAQPEAPMAAPLTTHDEGSGAAADDDRPLTSQAATSAAGVAPQHDWVDYVTLLLSLTSTIMLLYLISSVLPTMNRRINNLAADPEPEPEPRSMMSRLRPTRSQGLHEDRYEEDEEDDYEPTGPSRRDDD
ncbi:hypothetical protein [Hymenobacter arizonensis]|uniref:Uncharacterized protein n=1 Tax=Hymenobacter arizonensis TaxID=1227077 RepID=A0A1I5T0B3_HYMAR|nr:hypothetical protein [Hymenobacter arizonensis]SFP76469.1 hypothetical protein SAMN04515668_0267 [Hymenobacter arizonensis]